jgi:hypothetical protein
MFDHVTMRASDRGASEQFYARCRNWLGTRIRKGQELAGGL